MSCLFDLTFRLEGGDTAIFSAVRAENEQHAIRKALDQGTSHLREHARSVSVAKQFSLVGTIGGPEWRQV